MHNPQEVSPSKITSQREETRAAIQAWHRGETLSDEQLDLINQARIATLMRAHGVNL